MKPFLAIDLTTNKKNEENNGKEFLVQKTSDALSQSFDNSSEEIEQTIEKSKLPFIIRIIQWVCGFVGALIACGIVRAITDEDAVSLSEAYQNAAWLFWLGGICLVTWAVVAIMAVIKQKAVLETDESEMALDNLDKNCDAIFMELGVPGDAIDVDVLCFNYKQKDGKIKLCEKGLQTAEYYNPIFKAYTDSENLYLADLDGKYAFPLSSLKSIDTVKKTITILDWNKDEPFNKGIYKQYKLTETNMDSIVCKKYHILEFIANDEVWGIYFPNYELPAFEKLTGLKAVTID